MDEIKAQLEKSLGENFDDESYTNFMNEYTNTTTPKLEFDFSEFRQL